MFSVEALTGDTPCSEITDVIFVATFIFSHFPPPKNQIATHYQVCITSILWKTSFEGTRTSQCIIFRRVYYVCTVYFG